MTSYYTDQPAVGDVVRRLPGPDRPGKQIKDVPYVVAHVHDFRHEADPALYLSLVEEPAYRHYMTREGGVVGDWSPWHVVVGAEQVERRHTETPTTTGEPTT
jgi:hypothetical protein